MYNPKMPSMFLLLMLIILQILGVAHSQELLSCKQKLKDAKEVERQAAAEMAHWEAVQRNQEKAEHCLDCGKIQALLHSMGEDAMWEIFNDSLSESCMKYAK
jgi:hypothetical protein